MGLNKKSKASNKIIKIAKKELSNKKSVVIDATNPSKDKRKIFIDLALEYNIPVRCIYINTSFDESLHRNNNRQNIVPKIVYYVYRKKFQEPSIEEGFTNVYTISV